MPRLNREPVIAGIDEAGRGSVIGPLVVAGVSLKKSKLDLLADLGLKSSKMLSRKTRANLFGQIIDSVDSICVLILSTNDIDSSVFLRGLNKLEAEAMAEVINNIQPDNVYVDCCDVNPIRYKNYLKKYINYKYCKLYSFHHADELHIVVSAASIIAKIVRDAQIYEIRKSHCNIGSGYPSDKLTMRFIRNYIRRSGDTPTFVRKSWKPVKIMLNESIEKQQRVIHVAGEIIDI
jgi:ribonuclease HII